MAQREERWWVEDRAAQFRQFASADGQTAPLYRHLADAIAEDAELLGLLDAAPPAQQRSVLLFAAVHFLVLADPGCDLGRFYASVQDPPAEPPEHAWPAFRAFCLERRDAISALVATRSTQTNEVGRSAALLPGLELVHRATGQPISLLEVGASAGLNLGFDRFRIEYAAPSWATPPWPPFTPAAAVGPTQSSVRVEVRVVGEKAVPVPATGVAPPIADRVGLDLHPGSVTDEDQMRWLEACVFPDRVDRLARLRAAIAACRDQPPRVEPGDAVADLARVAATVAGDGPLVVFHSWALTYVDDREGFAAAVAELAIDRDVWWLAAEPSSVVPGLVVAPRDERYSPAMAANTVTSLLHVRGGGRGVSDVPGGRGGRDDQVLARSHPHLDWIHWLA